MKGRAAYSGTGDQHLAPAGWRDLRGAPGADVDLLRYPRGSVLVVAGVPGAGKSTLLHRVFGTTGAEQDPVDLPDEVLLLDSEQARNRWRERLGPATPYGLYRPLVHLAHLGALVRALDGGSTLVVHDCGTRTWWRAMVLRKARARQVPVHLVLIDVPVGAALEGQTRRNRRVRSRAFRRHVRRWQLLLGGTEGADHAAVAGFASCLVLDRAGAGRLRSIEFGPARPAA